MKANFFSLRPVMNFWSCRLKYWLIFQGKHKAKVAQKVTTLGKILEEKKASKKTKAFSNKNE
ncbi:MAG: hypothetical protein mread185_000149 [Mycoplasmataceae bacterium]|nr:MAG: hypothetical protein mread185_000149 [Mycoplasmataceae bacterium]